MSCFADGSEEGKRSTKISQNLQEMWDAESKIIKLLLLGTGGSGKSTVFKQMRMIHTNGFSVVERKSFKGPISHNVLEIFSILIEGAVSLKIEIAESNRAFAKKLSTFSEEGSRVFFLTPEMADPLVALWKGKMCQSVYQRRTELLQFPDNTMYFCKKLSEMCHVDYVPSVEDLLYCRKRTIGIVQEKFQGFGKEKRTMLFVDVGGQRNERRKWIHAFDSVTCVIFLVSISGYNQVIEEDNKTNRMHEALGMFNTVCNDRHFKKKSVIIFYNKEDLFREKIQKVDLKVCWPEYSGGKNYKNATEFIMKKFNDTNINKKYRNFFGHLTTATNTENIRTVFKDCQDIILSELLSETNFI